MRNQLGDGFRFLGLFVIPMLKKQGENLLGKLVIIGVAGFDLSIPIIRETHDIQLFTETLNVLFGGNGRMLSGLDGILFCGESECIISHGVQHIEAIEAFVSGYDIAGDISKGMSYVQTTSRRVRKHVEHIVFGLVGVNGNGI